MTLSRPSSSFPEFPRPGSTARPRVGCAAQHNRPQDSGLQSDVRDRPERPGLVGPARALFRPGAGFRSDRAKSRCIGTSTRADPDPVRPRTRPPPALRPAFRSPCSASRISNISDIDSGPACLSTGFEWTGRSGNDSASRMRKPAWLPCPHPSSIRLSQGYIKKPAGCQTPPAELEAGLAKTHPCHTQKSGRAEVPAARSKETDIRER